MPAFRLVAVARGAGALARDAVRRPRARARADRAQAWERAERGAALRAVHDRRRGGRRQVAPRRRGARPRSTRASSAAAAFPTARGSRTGRSSRCSSSSTRVPSDAAAAAAIRSLLGETEQATSAEEIAWAFRKLLEDAGAARRRLRRHPLGRGHVPRPRRARRRCSRPARRSCSSASPGPSCSTRRPAWPVALRLEPLAERDVDELDRRARPARAPRSGSQRAAGGNPLFLTELLAMARRRTATSRSRRPSSALLAARLDQLDARRAARARARRRRGRDLPPRRGARRSRPRSRRSRRASPRSSAAS